MLAAGAAAVRRRPCIPRASRTCRAIARPGRPRWRSSPLSPLWRCGTAGPSRARAGSRPRPLDRRSTPRISGAPLQRLRVRRHRASVFVTHLRRTGCQCATWARCEQWRRAHVIEKSRRRPTLPGGLPPSTIGAGGLNCRVRNGNGCFPAAMATGNHALRAVVRPMCASAHPERPKASTSKSQALGRLVPVG